MIMKTIKSIAMIWLVFFSASAVHNWGGELTKNPVFVFVGLMVAAGIMAFCEVMGGMI